ncbi:hypothetical protein VNO80_17676 [Phaseolus coccineus]|uniref:Uncharacterized protein n=1 Tax=Phaseolus coccineus TaxID=3886 RepID=A0AAN9MD58_PHACN
MVAKQPRKSLWLHGDGPALRNGSRRVTWRRRYLHGSRRRAVRWLGDWRSVVTRLESTSENPRSVVLV